jgi:hypothetical protein
MAMEKRKGCSKLYATAFNSGAAIKSLYEYRAPNGTNYVLVSSGTALGYYTGSAWVTLIDADTDITPPVGGLTSGKRCSFATHNGYCYIVNGVDLNFKMKNANVLNIVGVPAPSTAPTVEVNSTGLTGTYKYIYCYTHDADTSLGMPQLIGNPSPPSAAITVANQGIKVYGFCAPAYDTEVKTLILYRTLDTGLGDTDSTLYFKVTEIPNTATSITSLTTSFVGTGLNDLINVESLLVSTNVWVKLNKLASAVTAVRHKAGAIDPIHAVTTTDATATVQFAVRLSGKTHYKVKPGPIHDSSWRGVALVDSAETGNTYGTTVWHINTLLQATLDKDDYIDYEFFNIGIDQYVVSVDSGVTWSEATNCSETLNSYGDVSWKFTADTGHTIGDIWKITSNTTTAWSYVDTKVDNDLTTLAAFDNTPPPIAKFICLHKDRMIYANCPKTFAGEDIPGGNCMFMFSSVGAPEKCPSTNYQYFDRSDGNEITGIASIPDYLIVFKKNKIAAMEGDFVQWYTISHGVGCIAPWSITVVGGKVYFLSEEGYKATDGRLLYDIGKRLRSVSQAQYLTTTAAVEYTSIYYPEKCQIHTNFYHATLNNVDLVAHLLDTLYQEVGPESSSNSTNPLQNIGFTYHEYDDHGTTHALRTFGTYTDATGITRPIAGSDDGFVYLLDSGTHDVDYADVSKHIVINIETGWTAMGSSEQVTKTMRGINVRYASDVTSNAGSALLYYDVDFVRGTNSVALTGGGAAYTGGPMGSANYNFLGVSENLPVIDAAVGRMFRFRLYDLSHNNFTLLSIVPYFREENRR